MGIANYGVSVVVLASAGLCTIGFVVAYFWAPETKGLSLTQVSS